MNLMFMSLLLMWLSFFDSVDRGVLDLVLARLGLPVWFRRVYFGYHANVRLRFKLACGLGSPWTWDGGIPQGCPLSMVFCGPIPSLVQGFGVYPWR